MGKYPVVFYVRIKDLLIDKVTGERDYGGMQCSFEVKTEDTQISLNNKISLAIQGDKESSAILLNLVQFPKNMEGTIISKEDYLKEFDEEEE